MKMSEILEELLGQMNKVGNRRGNWVTKDVIERGRDELYI